MLVISLFNFTFACFFLLDQSDLSFFFRVVSNEATMIIHIAFSLIELFLGTFQLEKSTDKAYWIASENNFFDGKT